MRTQYKVRDGGHALEVVKDAFLGMSAHLQGKDAGVHRFRVSRTVIAHFQRFGVTVSTIDMDLNAEYH